MLLQLDFSVFACYCKYHYFACRSIETHLSEMFDSDMNDQNEHQLAENMNADSPDTKPEPTPETSRSPKGKGSGGKYSPGVKIALWIGLTIIFLMVYHTAAAAAAFLRAGVIGKTGIDSAIAVRKILKDNPSVFFTGEADVAFAYGSAPEMRRWNGRYQILRIYTFTFGEDAMEWNIYIFTEKVEDAEKIRRELASRLSELDEKDNNVLYVRKYHVWFYHSWPAPSPWDPEEFAKMPSYADYRLDLDNL